MVRGIPDSQELDRKGQRSSGGMEVIFSQVYYKTGGGGQCGDLKSAPIR